MDESSSPLSRDTVERIVAELEQALVENAAWLQRWHRSVVCKVKPSLDVTSERSHLLTRFGSWYDLHHDDPLLSQPAFVAVAQSHERMHEHGRWLAQRAWQDERVPVEEYDALAEKVTAFEDGARRLLRAFRSALSDIDPLTGAQTRQTMLKELRREQMRSARARQGCCVALGDLDHFKRINDAHGHIVGDQVLAAATECFIAALRPYDLIFRFGGEEFLFCLPDSRPEDAVTALNRLRVRLARESIPVVDGAPLSVTASFGVAPLPSDVPIEIAIQRADAALYAAKRAGRNRVVAWRPDLATAPKRAPSAAATC